MSLVVAAEGVMTGSGWMLISGAAGKWPESRRLRAIPLEMATLGAALIRPLIRFRTCPVADGASPDLTGLSLMINDSSI